MEGQVRSHPSGLSHKYRDSEEATLSVCHTAGPPRGEAQVSFLCRRGAQQVPREDPAVTQGPSPGPWRRVSWEAPT